MNQRTIKQLLDILLESIEKNGLEGCSGLCLYCQFLATKGVINCFEKELLIQFMIKNRPKKGEVFYDNKRKHGHYFNQSDKSIRIKWLKHLIKNCEK